MSIEKAAKMAVLSTMTALLMVGCGSTPHAPVKPPIRPIFSTYTPDLWASLPLEAQENIVSDDLACKRYIKSVEERLRIHNGE